jgi:hypothetical protein
MLKDRRHVLRRSAYRNQHYAAAPNGSDSPADKSHPSAIARTRNHRPALTLMWGGGCQRDSPAQAPLKWMRDKALLKWPRLSALRRVRRALKKKPRTWQGLRRRRFAPCATLTIVSRRRPKEHLMAVLVQNAQAIGVLGQIQRLEGRLGFHLCTLQIRRDVGSAIERGVRVVAFSNAEEFNGEHYARALFAEHIGGVAAEPES